MEKDEHEYKTLVKYRKIYPVEGKQYKEMEEFAVKVFNEHSGFKNKEISKTKEEPIRRIGSRPASLQHIPNSKKLKGNNIK